MLILMETVSNVKPTATNVPLLNAKPALLVMEPTVLTVTSAVPFLKAVLLAWMETA